MNENKLSLSNLTIRHVGGLMRLPSGLLKREITVAYGKQSYIVDEIRKQEEEFEVIDPRSNYDMVLWVNGMETRGGVVHKFCLKRIRPSYSQPVQV
jgi:hypothetical protein